MRPASGRQSFWVPNTNVFTSPSGQLIVQVELSSMRSENLEITVEGNSLRVSGERQISEFADAEKILVHEINSGPFESVLELPPEFDLRLASACYLNGVLRITVPKADPPPPTITLR